MRRYYIVQLAFETWLAPWYGEPATTRDIAQAKRFTSPEPAEAALEAARKFQPFREAFVDVLKATVI